MAAAAATSEADKILIEKCLEMFEQYPFLQPKRSRKYLEANTNIRRYFANLRKRVALALKNGKVDATRSEPDDDAKSVASTHSRTEPAGDIPDFTQQVEAAFHKQKAEQPPPQPEQFAGAVPSEVGGGVHFAQTEVIEDDLVARRLRVQLLLARDDLGDEAMKILEKTKKLKIDRMNGEELTAMEELVGVALSKNYSTAATEKLLGAAGRIIEKTAARPAGTVTNVLEKDTLLKQDISTLLGRFAIGTSTAIRAAALFSLDVGIALFHPPAPPPAA